MRSGDGFWDCEAVAMVFNPSFGRKNVRTYLSGGGLGLKPRFNRHPKRLPFSLLRWHTFFSPQEPRGNR